MWQRLTSLYLTLSERARRKRSPCRRPPSHRPVVEALEDRAVPSGASLAGYGQLPLSFEVNRGQTAPQVNYLARGDGYTLFLSATQATLGLTTPSAPKGAPSAGDVLRLALVGANPAAPVTGLDQLPGVSNYFTGSDPSQWLTNVPTYGEVEYQGVYPGVNLVYYGNQGQLEYDFVLAPGADPGAIRLSVQGGQSVSLDAQGDLVLHAAGGDVLQHAPVVYQNIGGQRQAVAGRFVLQGDGQVGFQVRAYDHSAPLVIDPVLVYSTYLGGSNGDGQANGIAVDSAGNAYVTGWTRATNFPVTPGAFQTTNNSGVDTQGNQKSDAFVAKLNAGGTALVYSTYLGPSVEGFGIAVDGAGDAYVTGTTNGNFPTTPGAFQGTAPNGVFVAKLNATGSALIYSTCLGPGQGEAIAVDASGNAYVTGYSTAPTPNIPVTFPTTPGAFQTSNPDPYDGTAFVTELNASGSGLVYSTFLGGSSGDQGNAIAVDSAGNAYVAGQTWDTAFPTTPGAFQPNNPSGALNGVGFVTKLNATGSALVYSTYLGGTAGNGDDARGIAVDAAGSAYVTGITFDSDFPTTAGAFRTSPGPGFVTKFNSSGSAPVYSTFLAAGSGGIALDSSGDAYVPGDGASVSELNASGSAQVFSMTLAPIGNNGGKTGTTGIALDSSGNVYVAGWTQTPNFPTMPGAFQTTDPASTGVSEPFVAKINPAPSPCFAVAGFPSPTTAGVPHSFTVTALNADGTVNTGYTGTVHFSSSDPQAALPANYTFTAADQGVHTFSVTLKTAGSQSIAAKDTATGSITGSEAGIAVQPAAATHFGISGPATVRANSTFNLTVTALDAYGNVATGYRGTVHFSDSAGGATLPGNYTFTAADAGVHTFAALKLKTKGTQTITVTDTLNGLLLGKWTLTVT